MPRLHALNVYHSLEDSLVDRAGKRDGMTWSVHRPSIIVGFSSWNHTNLVSSLAVYATICKHEGTPFRCLGNATTWERFVDVADADLVAEQEVPVPYSGKLVVTLEQMMKGKDEVWDEIVLKYGLHSTKLSEVGCWWYVDSLLSSSAATVLDMNKRKELGFVAFRNTERSILHRIDEMKHISYIP
ncbi:hypothetical protein L7F22_036902 [Adiantum nelumboides]|nr:hypothetical protein [Adiantum nelumboides]